MIKNYFKGLEKIIPVQQASSTLMAMCYTATWEQV